MDNTKDVNVGKWGGGGQTAAFHLVLVGRRFLCGGVGIVANLVSRGLPS